MMKASIRFLSAEDVILIHEKIVLATGGISEIRDRGLLESAVMQAQIATHYQDDLDIFDVAAIYLFHIIKNHPFIDGNKRTGLTTALTFLHANNISKEYDFESLYELTLSTASSSVEKTTIARFFRGQQEKG